MKKDDLLQPQEMGKQNNSNTFPLGAMKKFFHKVDSSVDVDWDKNKETRISQLVKILKGHNVVIQTHNFPDPDAIASAFALQYLLRLYDVESKIVYDGTLNKISGLRIIDYFNISMSQVEDVKDLKEDDYVILVDAQKYNMNCTDIVGDEVACIDHHPTVVECDYAYKDIRMVGACATLITDYIFEAGFTPPEDLATLLLYGIKIDTADFSRGVSQLDVRAYYQLFPYANHHVLEQLTLNSIEFSDLRAYGSAINNITAYKNIGFASINFDCPDRLIATISDFILALDLVEFSVVYSVRENGYKFSARSELEELDAGKILGRALEMLGDGNGGGHAFMAGGFLPMDSVKKLGDNPRKAIELAFDKVIYPEDEDYEKNTICNKVEN